MAEIKFLSVWSDGSTESAVLEQEILYARFSNGGKVEVHFVGIQDVEKADGEGIGQAIDAMMQRINGEWQTKLVACCTDGASVKEW